MSGTREWLWGRWGGGGMSFSCSHLYAGTYQTEHSFPAGQRSLLDWGMLDDSLGVLFILCGPVLHPDNNSNSNNS